MRLKLWLPGLLLLSAISAPIQVWAADPGQRSEPSVYSVSLPKDGALIGVTAAGSLLPYVFASHLIQPRCPCDIGEINSLDRHVVGNQNPFLDGFSDASAGAAVVLPVIGDLLDVGSGAVFWEDMIVYSEVLSINGALVSLAKYTVQRPLPRVYAGQDPQLATEPGGYRSFYSGHTSLTFASLSAASMTLSFRHGTGAWPWLLTAGFGISVAAERVAAGRHFYTDVALGAVAGTVVGVVVPLLHRRNENAASSVSVIPSYDGAELAWTKRF